MHLVEDMFAIKILDGRNGALMKRERFDEHQARTKVPAFRNFQIVLCLECRSIRVRR